MIRVLVYYILAIVCRIENNISRTPGAPSFITLQKFLAKISQLILATLKVSMCLMLSHRRALPPRAFLCVVYLGM